MSKQVHKYRLFCNTEQTYHFVWSDSTPTTCPANNQHEIDNVTISIIDSITTSAVNIVQESVPTGGNYRVEGRKLDISANSTQSEDIVFPYQLSVLTITIHTSEENEDDILNCYIAPNTTVGVLTQAATQGDTTLHVWPTVVANMKVGYRVSIVDSVPIDLGECIAMDTVNNTITLQSGIPQGFDNGSFVQMTINNVKNFVLKGDTVYELARKTIGSSALAPGLVVRIQYQNLGETPKKFYYSFEYMY
jgi:hypothetical protein